eukprot:2824726-Rhodomonas_salina.3
MSLRNRHEDTSLCSGAPKHAGRPLTWIFSSAHSFTSVCRSEEDPDDGNDQVGLFVPLLDRCVHEAHSSQALASFSPTATVAAAPGTPSHEPGHDPGAMHLSAEASYDEDASAAIPFLADPYDARSDRFCASVSGFC